MLRVLVKHSWDPEEDLFVKSPMDWAALADGLRSLLPPVDFDLEHTLSVRLRPAYEWLSEHKPQPGALYRLYDHLKSKDDIIAMLKEAGVAVEEMEKLLDPIEKAQELKDRYDKLKALLKVIFKSSGVVVEGVVNVWARSHNFVKRERLLASLIEEGEVVDAAALETKVSALDEAKPRVVRLRPAYEWLSEIEHNRKPGSGGSAIRVGARVLSLRANRHPEHCGARVTAANADGSYAITYDDGDKESRVARKMIKSEDDASGGSAALYRLDPLKSKDDIIAMLKEAGVAVEEMEKLLDPVEKVQELKDRYEKLKALVDAAALKTKAPALDEAKPRVVDAPLSDDADAPLSRCVTFSAEVGPDRKKLGLSPLTDVYMRNERMRNGLSDAKHIATTFAALHKVDALRRLAMMCHIRMASLHTEL